MEINVAMEVFCVGRKFLCQKCFLRRSFFISWKSAVDSGKMLGSKVFQQSARLFTKLRALKFVEKSTSETIFRECLRRRLWGSASARVGINKTKHLAFVLSKLICEILESHNESTRGNLSFQLSSDTTASFSAGIILGRWHGYVDFCKCVNYQDQQNESGNRRQPRVWRSDSINLPRSFSIDWIICWYQLWITMRCTFFRQEVFNQIESKC